MLFGCSTDTKNHGGFATIGKAIMSPFGQSHTEDATDSKKSFLGQGNSPVGLSNGEVATITQPDNPSQKSSQTAELSKEDITTYSKDTDVVTKTVGQDGSVVTVTEHVPAGSKKVSKVNQHVGQEIGAAQKDAATSLAAGLASFRGVQYIGAVALLIGLVGFFNPTVRVIIGGKDTAMAVGLGGIAMIFGPYLFVAYANYFFLAILAVAIYWFLARFKYQHGLLDALTGHHS